MTGPGVPPSSPPSAQRSPPLVELERVTKTYQRGQSTVHALRNVSLRVPDGQFLGVEGPSGSGKSTLLHLLAALDRPSRGTLRIGDWFLNNLDTMQRASYRRSMVGLVFQEFNLIPTMTALENVALPLILGGVNPKTRKPRAAQILESVGLGDRTDHRPSQLSGGEQQRVATARALVGDPPLLLADEPTGNLDQETGAQIIELLAELHREQGRTVVVVTHHVEEIEAAADRVVRLRDGALVDAG